MAHEFNLPDVGDGIEEAEVLKWMVNVGDGVLEDDPIAEVETERAIIEIPSPVDGAVDRLHADEGETVGVGNRLVTFEKGEGGTEARNDGGVEILDSDGNAAVDVDADGGDEDTVKNDGDDDGASEATRRLAREMGVSLDDVEGSGADGRIVAQDVLHAAKQDQEERDGARGDEEAEDPGTGIPGKGEKTPAMEDDDTAPDFGQPETPAVEPNTAEETSMFGDETPTAERSDESEGEEGEPETEKEKEAGVEAETERGTEAKGETGKEAEKDDGEGEEETEAVTETGTERGGGIETETEEEIERKTGEDEEEDEGSDGTEDEASAKPRRTVEEIGKETEEEKVESPFDEAGDVTDENGDVTEGTKRTCGTDSTEEGTTPDGSSRTRAEDEMDAKTDRSGEGRSLMTHHDVADAERLVEAREAMNGSVDMHLTYTPLLVKACSVALVDHGVFGEEDAEGVDVGVAVETEDGVAVPVVENADRRGVVGISNRIAEAVEGESSGERGETGDTDAGFTVVNVGAVGGDGVSPVVDMPGVTALSVGEIRRRPSVVDDEVVARYTAPLHLTFDGRVADTAKAVRLTNEIGRYLSEPATMLL